MNKPFVPYSESLSAHLQNGGAGTVFHNPIMHYDLASMGKYFTEINKEAGIYEKNGVLYASKDLNGHPALQPLGVYRGADGKWVAQGFSDKLSEVQTKELQERILPALEASLKKAPGTSASSAEMGKALADFTKLSQEDQEKFLTENLPREKTKEDGTEGEAGAGDKPEGPRHTVPPSEQK